MASERLRTFLLLSGKRNDPLGKPGALFDIQLGARGGDFGPENTHAFGLPLNTKRNCLRLAVQQTGLLVTDAARPQSDSLHRRLVRYYYDCLAAQTDWGRAINVVEQRDVTLVPLAASELERFGETGMLRMSDPEAIDLAKRVTAGGADTSLSLGALFIVGRIEAKGDQAEKRFCAPLLEVSLSLRQESEGQIMIYPEETEFSVNYSLVGELLGGESDDLQDRLADLSESVPDFPIDAGEFDAFWNSFRMIAPEVKISHQPPARRKKSGSTRIDDLGLASESSRSADGTLESDVQRLDMVDFYMPQIAKGDEFQLLPATAIIFGQKAGRSMSALSELRSMEEMQLTETAFGCLFDPSTARPWSAKPIEREFPDEIQPLPLSPAQELIVESARTAPLTVVTGPPGTGKSYTITAIVLDALLNGETVLVASQMDKAVEVVADQVETIAGSLAIARSGGRAAQRKLAKKVKKLTGPSSSLDVVTTADVTDCARRHYQLTRRLQQLEGRFQEVIEAERNWSRSCVAYDRAQPLCRLPVMEVSAERVDKAQQLIERAEKNQHSDAGFLRRWLGRWELSRARRQLEIPAATEADVDDLEELLRAQSLRVEIRRLERELKAPFPADLVWQELADVQRQRQQTAIELLRLMRHKRLQKLVSDGQNRSALRDLATLLRRRKHELKRELQQKLSAELLLEAFPAWACISRSLCEVLPATPALFDIVVIDEASQCDLALASVALMRAKRAVVVGDPNQLRHVSFLSRAREDASFVRSEFTPEMQHRYHYRRSLFDVAADAVDQRNFFLLDEHFRSHPQIIEFSNRRFYDGALQIMTGRPSRSPQSAITVNRVQGRRELDSSVNPTEVEAVLDAIRSIVARGASHLSIGVVSPFRDHADAIRERLLREYSSDVISRHAMVVGTAHSLQGDEKDVIVFSTSIDSQSHPASLRFLESPNLFNVAITRARDKLIVVTSMTVDELPVGLLRDFLLHAAEGWSPQQSPNESDSMVESAIIRQLQAEQIDYWSGFHSAGSRINVVAMGDVSELAVMCDGGSNQEAAASTLAAHRRLARAGWNVNRIPHRTLHNDSRACLIKIIHRIGG